ncbi:hypothetical protein B9J78_02430 [bacterium Unc6]|nr:hypothetical protein [bacterium Unc6]
MENFFEKMLINNIRKPARYVGNEWNIIRKNNAFLKVALCFPDIYEVGMSHLGLKILYSIGNLNSDISCERVFAPWPDMEELMRKEGVKLYSLETYTPVKDFDIVGFSYQYEMLATNILNMLELSGLNIRSDRRLEKDPVIIAGGSAVYNPCPISRFIDAFVIGDGEIVFEKILKLFYQLKKQGFSKKAALEELSKVSGVYVPCLHNTDTVAIVAQKVDSLDDVFFPTSVVVPNICIVHDRIAIEIMRGCTGGCRFCQAGFVNRPRRERSVEKIIQLAEDLYHTTGYEEISLLSLSSGCYSSSYGLLQKMIEKFKTLGVGISFPSLCIDKTVQKFPSLLKEIYKTGLTFAPEVGTDRMRRVINKDINEQVLLDCVASAYKQGWGKIKLYFMIGLPTETDEDVEKIAEISLKVSREGKKIARQSTNVTISVSTFVPKSHTPFQWEKMCSEEQIYHKIDIIQKKLVGSRIKTDFHNPKTSILEALIARGNEKIADVIEWAWKNGARFDAWNEHFKQDIWDIALKKNGIDVERCLCEKNLDEKLPWDFIDIGIKKEHLMDINRSIVRTGNY